MIADDFLSLLRGGGRDDDLPQKYINIDILLMFLNRLSYIEIFPKVEDSETLPLRLL